MPARAVDVVGTFVSDIASSSSDEYPETSAILAVTEVESKTVFSDDLDRRVEITNLTPWSESECVLRES